MPLHIPLKRKDVEENLAAYIENALPPGWTGEGPQILKVHEGEFLIYPDHTAQFVNRTTGEWGPRFRFKKSLRDVMLESLQDDESWDYGRRS